LKAVLSIAFVNEQFHKYLNINAQRITVCWFIEFNNFMGAEFSFVCAQAELLVHAQLKTATGVGVLLWHRRLHSRLRQPLLQWRVRPHPRKAGQDG
jgi:hypothetical protein